MVNSVVHTYDVCNLTSGRDYVCMRDIEFGGWEI
jgi:hypothetical protein